MDRTYWFLWINLFTFNKERLSVFPRPLLSGWAESHVARLTSTILELCASTGGNSGQTHYHRVKGEKTLRVERRWDQKLSRAGLNCAAEICQGQVLLWDILGHFCQSWYVCVRGNRARTQKQKVVAKEKIFSDLLKKSAYRQVLVGRQLNKQACTDAGTCKTAMLYSNLEELAGNGWNCDIWTERLMREGLNFTIYILHIILGRFLKYQVF